MGELGWAPGGGGWGIADVGKLSWGFRRLQTFLLATHWPSVRGKSSASCRGQVCRGPSSGPEAIFLDTLSNVARVTSAHCAVFCF